MHVQGCAQAQEIPEKALTFHFDRFVEPDSVSAFMLFMSLIAAIWISLSSQGKLPREVSLDVYTTL